VADDPQTWHYGLVARWWAEFNQPDPEELAFYQGFVARDGQPALDLACGAGRLLLPMLRAGLRVDGCDVSADMLALCQAAADREGLHATLHQQAMHELDLPGGYRTIYVCDSFGIGGRRDWDAEMLRRCHRLLADGGVLVMSHYLPYDDPERWPLWLPEHRQRLPEAWPETGARKRAANGEDIELRVRVLDLDPMAQQLTMQMRASLWRNGDLIEEEEGALVENLYFRNEIELLLASAGFEDIAVRRGYSDVAAMSGDTMVVFVARKRP
jgi:SAM-dependent methyltransferase